MVCGHPFCHRVYWDLSQRYANQSARFMHRNQYSSIYFLLMSKLPPRTLKQVPVLGDQNYSPNSHMLMVGSWI